VQTRHVPTINARYWTGITLASIFGTNMGDFYAHESGLGLLGGLPILVGLFLIVYVAERFDKLSHDAYYWLCIIIMRTGATNIADYSAGRRGLHIDRWVLSAGFGVALLALALWAARDELKANGPAARKALPDTNPRYWVAMLLAGIFGTVLGDACQGLMGQGVAAIVLSVILAVALLIYRNGLIGAVLAYWLTVGVARTTGTAIGDWLAENKVFDIGLSRCTLMTGVVFLAVLLLWRNRRPVEATAAA
jgi:uncharacterized membrane-anchored protein